MKATYEFDLEVVERTEPGISMLNDRKFDFRWGCVGPPGRGFTAPVEKIPYSPERLAAQPCDIWHFQETLFVIDSFDQLEREFVRWAKDHRLL